MPGAAARPGRTGRAAAEERQRLQARAGRRSGPRAGRRRRCSSRPPAGPGRRRRTPTLWAPATGRPPAGRGRRRAARRVGVVMKKATPMPTDEINDAQPQRPGEAPRRPCAGAAAGCRRRGWPPRSPRSRAHGRPDQRVRRGADVEVAGRAEGRGPGDEHHLQHRAPRAVTQDADPDRAAGARTKVSSQTSVNE